MASDTRKTKAELIRELNLHKAALVAQEAASAAALAAQTIATLEKNNEILAGDLIALRTELTSSKDSITAIAEKALEASSQSLGANMLMEDRRGRDGQLSKARS